MTDPMDFVTMSQQEVGMQKVRSGRRNQSGLQRQFLLMKSDLDSPQVPEESANVSTVLGSNSAWSWLPVICD